MGIINIDFVINNKHDVQRTGFYDKGTYNSIITIDGVNYRERSEVICFSKDMKSIFLDMKDDYYNLPGGSLDENESPISAAIRELKEEPLIIGRDFKRHGIRLEKYKYISDFIKSLPTEYQWSGDMSYIYSCIYDRRYDGYVDEVDKDNMVYSGKFYDIDDIYDKLIPEHKKVIDKYRDGH